jgi:metal-responsive CopG/Arc/MetJ family transcriptional regulator
MKSDERVAVSVVLEPAIVDELDRLAKAADMNRSQYIRKLAREEIARAAKSLHQQPEAAAA